MIAGKSGAVGVLLHFHQPPLKIDGEWQNNIRKMWQHPHDDADRWNIACYIGSYRALPASVNGLSRIGLRPRIMADFSGVLLHGLVEAEKLGLFEEMAREKSGSNAGPVVEELAAACRDRPEALDLLATGFYHPLFHPAATPKSDWPLHIDEYLKLFRSVLGDAAAASIRGFWPPEMAVPGDPADLYDLIEILRARNIRWIALPSVPTRDRENESALRPAEGKEIGFHERFYAPHVVVGRKDGKENRIVGLVRDPRCEPNKGCDPRARAAQAAGEYRAELARGRRDAAFPPFVLIAGDGENGSEMMQGNFFRERFNPFVATRPEETLFPLVTGTSYIEEVLTTAFGKPDWDRAGEIFTELRIQPEGYSWSGVLGNIWLSRPSKIDLYKEIFAVSEEFHAIGATGADPAAYEEAKHAVLRTQTSCYTWWESDFWLNQGWEAIEDARAAIARLT
jgi:hypothetical protein